MQLGVVMDMTFPLQKLISRTRKRSRYISECDSKESKVQKPLYLFGSYLPVSWKERSDCGMARRAIIQMTLARTMMPIDSSSDARMSTTCHFTIERYAHSNSQPPKYDLQ